MFDFLGERATAAFDGVNQALAHLVGDSEAEILPLAIFRRSASRALWRVLIGHLVPSGVISAVLYHGRKHLQETSVSGNMINAVT
jgi:hypothetical protein